MKKTNIKKNLRLLSFLIAAGLLIYSCSDEDSWAEPTGSGQETNLSIFLNATEDGTLRSSGNQDVNAESKIYSLEVLVFRSEGEAEGGKLDGYGAVVREVVTVTGQTYDKEYKEIEEIKAIGMTAGKRDVYVVANAPDNYFQSVTTLQEFLGKYEDLSTQGFFPHPGGASSEPDDDLPIGGIEPSDLKTNLTMCSFIKNVSFSNQHDQHFLGYTTNNGRPENVPSNYGFALNGVNPFLVERLVARVAIQKIEFDLPASLPFEGSNYPSDDYTYQIDSVFMLNVKTTSTIAAGVQPVFLEKFGHGCNTGYAFLGQAGCLDNLHSQSLYTNYLAEPITTPNYDISVNATPLWFYVFENEDGVSPTYFVIGVRYYFRSSKDNTVKTVKTYYPVTVNTPNPGKTADHDYIRRNHQYQISVKIKGLGSMYGNNPVRLRGIQGFDPDIEITEKAGRNLFSWTGSIYK